MTIKFYIPNTGFPENICLKIITKQGSQSEYKDFHFITPIKIPFEDWDEKKQRPVNIYLKKYKKINAILGKLKIRIAEYIKKKIASKSIVSKRGLSLLIKKIYSQKKNHYSQSSLLYFIQLYIDSKREFVCNSTHKRYKVFLHLVEKFEGSMMERLHINAIDYNFLKNFILFGKEEAYSENTIYRTIHFIRTILNFAERRGIRTAVRELEIRKDRQPRELITLTEQEIIEIKKTHLPKELIPAKDWLIISCYTGQRVSDFMEFSIEKLVEINGKTCIAFTQKKTKKNILLPLHPTVLNILRRNNNNFPKKLTPSQYNEQIKKIALLAGLTQPIKAKKRMGHRAQNVLSEKWEIVSSHIGRRSFASNFYGKIPTSLLMEATGHTTEQMFLKYINTADQGRVLRLSRYFDKIYFKKTLSSIKVNV